MPEYFERGGLRFQYPDNWSLESGENDDGWNVAVHSPGTAFLLLTIRHDLPDTETMAETALEALREDYPNLEAEEVLESLCGQPVIGHEMRFFSLDLTNLCWTRCFQCPQGTALFLCQSTDLENYDVVLRAIYASLELED